MFCEGFFSFFFTPNALVHSGLRGVGEAVKAINENLLMGECARSYAYARSARGCARSCVNWGGGWKSGEEKERKWGMRNGRGVDWEIKVGQGVKNEGKHESEKHSRCVKKGVRRK